MKLGYFNMPAVYRGGRRRTRTCDLCGEKTNEGKPLCEEHVTSFPLAKLLAAEVERRRVEQEAVYRWLSRHRSKKAEAAVDVQGSLCADVIATLKARGATSPKRVAVEVGCAISVFLVYARVLRREGLVELHEVASLRGGTRLVLELTEKGLAAECPKFTTSEEWRKPGGEVEAEVEDAADDEDDLHPYEARYGWNMTEPQPVAYLEKVECEDCGLRVRVCDREWHRIHRHGRIEASDIESMSESKEDDVRNVKKEPCRYACGKDVPLAGPGRAAHDRWCPKRPENAARAKQKPEVEPEAEQEAEKAESAEPAKEKPVRRRANSADPSLSVLSRCVEEIESVPEEGRLAIVSYLWGRFGARKTS